MLKLEAPLELELSRFFRWWGSALVSLIPKKWRIKRPRIVLKIDSDRIDAHYHESPPSLWEKEAFADDSGWLDLGSFSLDEAGLLKREQIFAKMPELKQAECALMLSSGQFLQNTVKLPMAAEENLRQVMAFEMDRLTPFKAESVYFDFIARERDTETRRIAVDWALTPKPKLDEFLESLLNLGFHPERVDLGNGLEGSGYNLLPEKYRQKKDNKALILSIALFSVLSIAVLLLPLLMSRSLLLDLQQQSKSFAKTAKEVESLREQVEKQEHESGFLSQKKRVEPAMLDMLNELSRVIPDSTWLNGVQYRDHRLIIQGQSPAASSLIEQIEKSPYFKNTSFVSPVTKDVATGYERFQISSEVENGRFSDKSPE